MVQLSIRDIFTAVRIESVPGTVCNDFRKNALFFFSLPDNKIIL